VTGPALSSGPGPADDLGDSDRAPSPDLDQFYDDANAAGLTCRVCGCLVPRGEDYPEVHWAWHEATNGA
jgi:hypothetical protein